MIAYSMEQSEQGGSNTQRNASLRSVKEAAAVLGVSRFSLYRKIKNCDVPGYKYGRKVLVDVEEVIRHLAIKRNDSNGKQ